MSTGRAREAIGAPASLGLSRNDEPRGRDGCGPRRPSSRGRWRALSLILVHAAVAAHIVHWKVTGRTLTPVEPSEAMQTLGREALLNAGFIFFALLILSTFVFGRFFCGWGCHVVALQDLCTWLLRKTGLQPQPFRSRLLVYVPLAAAVWMFVLPTFVRLWLDQSRSPLRSHFTTEDFWERFPSWPIALLTFAVCGFLIVYLLGNKGFCTYACPYGGIFAIADQFAPGKIRVTDACEGCGHCTATCTSNVRVHEEVRVYGMVVDRGCMKCMDCVNVCPKGALYFGFGRPSLRARQRSPRPQRRYDYSWPEEIALVALFAISIVILRGLYDRVPFLLALGLAAISSAVLFITARLFYVKDLRLARFQLRRAGKLRAAGVALLAVAALWSAFLTHSAVVKATAATGLRGLAASRGPVEDVATASAVDADGLRRAIGLLELSQRLALVSLGRLEAGIAEASELLGDRARAETHYRRAIELSPRYSDGRVQLARLLVARGETEEPLVLLREAIEIRAGTTDAAGDLASLLVNLGRTAEAAGLLEKLVEREPADGRIRLAYGVTLANLGEIDRGLVEIRQVLEHHPGFAEAHLKLGQLLAHQGQFGEALAELERASTLEPRDTAAHSLAAQVAVRVGRMDVVVRHLDAARRLEPFNDTIVATWASLMFRNDGLATAIAEAERAGPADRAARFRLMHLYRAGGRLEDAAIVEAELQARR